MSNTQTESKTVKEWLSELPEEYRDKALANMDRDVENISYKRCRDAIFHAFYWNCSNEGSNYWANLYVIL